MMKKSVWHYIVGVMMILGGWGSLIGDVHSINLPKMLDFQRQLIYTATEEWQDPDQSLTTNAGRASYPAYIGDIIKGAGQSVNKMLSVSDATKLWIVRFGYMGLLVSFIYILAGAFLLTNNNFSLILASVALVISVLFNSVEFIILADNASGFVDEIATMLLIPGIVVDLALAIVVIASRRGEYQMIRIAPRNY